QDNFDHTCMFSIDNYTSHVMFIYFSLRIFRREPVEKIWLFMVYLELPLLVPFIEQNIAFVFEQEDALSGPKYGLHVVPPAESFVQESLWLYTSH
ncbi:hypothetical protein ACJX0J_021732, partial [Zea mays]